MRIELPCCLALLFSLPALPATAAEELFARLDRDQDGQLVADEIESSHKRLFDRLLRTSDQDGDGKLSSIEFQSGLNSRTSEKPLVQKQGSQMPGANALLLILAQMDANADGRIASEEVPSRFRVFFDRLEERVGGDQDGLLSRREIIQFAPRMSQFALRLAQRLNLDVELELALLEEKQWQAAQAMTGGRQRGDALADSQRALEFFKRLDANGDGLVTLEEVPDQVANRFEMLLDRADRNRDDQISQRELMAVSRRMQARESSSMMSRPQEGNRAIAQMFRQLDGDGDRRVSRQEAPRRLARRFDRLDTDGSGYLERQEIATYVESLSAMRRPEISPSDRDRNEKKSEK